MCQLSITNRPLCPVWTSLHTTGTYIKLLHHTDIIIHLVYTLLYVWIINIKIVKRVIITNIHHCCQMVYQQGTLKQQNVNTTDMTQLMNPSRECQAYDRSHRVLYSSYVIKAVQYSSVRLQDDSFTIFSNCLEYTQLTSYS